MLLPNYQRAVIEDTKISEYCLNENHDIGKHKAIVFKSALGITSSDCLKLKQTILEAIKVNDCQESFLNFHGKLYVVDFEMINFGRRAIIRTGWIIKNDEDFPRLTTCYVKT